MLSGLRSGDANRCRASKQRKNGSNALRPDEIRSCQRMDAFIVMLQKHNTSSRMLLLRTRVDPYMLQRSKNNDRRPPSRSPAGASMFVIYILSKIRTYKLSR